MKTKHLSAFLILAATVCVMLSACTVPGLSFGCAHENQTTIDAKAATCVEKGYSGDTLCTDCNRVIKVGKETEATGHTFGEWTIVNLPKGGEEGLQQRSCLNCTECEKLNFTTISGKCETYAELIAVVLDDVIGIDSGSVKLEFATPDASAAASLDITKTESGYMLHGTYESGDTVELYYDNGDLYLIGANDSVTLSKVESLIGMPFADFKAGMDSFYTGLEIFTSEGLGQIKSVIGEFTASLGEDFDIILVDGYTLSELTAFLDAFEALHVKIADDFGYATTLKESDGALPTAEGYKNLLAAMMTAEEADGVTTYTLSASPLVDLAEAVYEFISAHSEDTLGDLIFLMLEEKITSYNEELTDINAVIDFIAKEFPGTIKVSEAIEKYESFAEENGLTGIDAIYTLIDKLALKVFGAEIDSKAAVNENAELTLDELISGMVGDDTATVDSLYSEIKALLADVIIGDLKVSDYMSLRSFGNNLKLIIDSTEIRGAVSISLNADGEVVEFSYDRELWMKPELDADRELEKVVSIKLSVTKSDDVVVEIPESVKSEAEKAE